MLLGHKPILNTNQYPYIRTEFSKETAVPSHGANTANPYKIPKIC